MIYAIVMLIVLPAVAFAFGLCRAAAKPAPKPERSTYRGPNDSAFDYAEFYYGHVDRKSDRRSYAEGRQTCTRRIPHVCTVNGPCNGLPKLPIAHFDMMKDGSLAYAYRVDLTAEGRPTMPSESEPESEIERRTR